MIAIRHLFAKAILTPKPLCFDSTIFRNYAARKRFYRRTGILQSDGKFEITLDQRKLKTPGGKLFVVESEHLAHAVAAEWDFQKDKVVPSTMHLTSLCNTFIDNPNHLTKYDMTEYLINYITTDTLLFQAPDDDELHKFQIEKWDPVIKWFCNRYQVDLTKSRGFDTPEIGAETKMILSRQFLSYDLAALVGFTFGVDALKSIILMLACVDRFVTPDQAVLLSRLEEEFQLGHWGRVEWAHDLSQQDLQARLSAALFLIQCQSNGVFEQKKIQRNS